MRINTLLVFLTVVALLVGTVLVIGCGDDDDDDNDDGGDDDVAGDRSINAFVRDFQTKAEVQDSVVELINNDDGEPFDPPVTVTSPSGGEVTLQVPEDYEGDLVGVKCTKSGYKDTYQYDFEIGSTNEEFLIVAEATATLVSGLLGITLDPEMGFAAGAIYWGNPDNENPVGCAEATTDPVPVDGIYYFNNSDLPTANREITTPGDPQNGQGVNPVNGYWIGMNFPTGDADITATSGDAEATAYLPKIYPDSVCISNVYFSFGDYDANPQEAWCTE